MILCIENSKNYTKKLLDIISEFHQAAGYQINNQISVAFLYTNNGLSEREIKKTISFTITTKKIRYLGINVTKEVKTCTWKILRY